MQAICRISTNFFRRFCCEESGAAYSLSVVLLLPVYIAVLAMIIEMTLLFLSHLAVTNACETAFHTTRSWHLHRKTLEQEGANLNEQIRNTASLAAIPFIVTNPPKTKSSSLKLDLASTLSRSGIDDLASKRMTNKLDFVRNSLEVNVVRQETTPLGYRVKLIYAAPLWTPLCGRVFGSHKGVDGTYRRSITREIFVPISKQDFPESEIGIPYSPQSSITW